MEFKILDEEFVQYQAEEFNIYSTKLKQLREQNKIDDKNELYYCIQDAVNCGAFYAEREFYIILQEIKKDPELLDRLLDKF